MTEQAYKTITPLELADDLEREGKWLIEVAHSLRQMVERKEAVAALGPVIVEVCISKV